MKVFNALTVNDPREETIRGECKTLLYKSVVLYTDCHFFEGRIDLVDRHCVTLSDTYELRMTTILLSKIVAISQKEC